jgi:hypothetical protein
MRFIGERPLRGLQIRMDVVEAESVSGVKKETSKKKGSEPATRTRLSP